MSETKPVKHVVSKLAPPDAERGDYVEEYEHVSTGEIVALHRGMTRHSDIEHLREAFSGACPSCVGIMGAYRIKPDGEHVTMFRFVPPKTRSLPGELCLACRKREIYWLVQDFTKQVEMYGGAVDLKVRYPE